MSGKTTLAMPRTHRITRRTALTQIGAATVGTLAAPAYLRSQTNPTIKIGFVSPTTGPLAPFGETDSWALERIRAFIGEGLEINGRTYAVEIIAGDAQSNPNRAAEIAGDMILNDEVALIMPASTTDVNNPVADQAELYGVPSVSSQSPWQAFIFPRGGAETPFEWTYHFFWGLEDALSTFVGLWDEVETNKKVGMLFPRNADGDTWGNEEYGLPPSVRAAGFEAVIPSMFEPRTNDYSAQISMFKEQGCDIVGGITYVSDLKTFVTQCNQQGYKPKVVTVAAALLFPSGVEAMGALGENMSTEVWWTPEFPFKSTLTGETSRDIANAWEASQNKQWIQPLGYSHAIWEVVIDALKRAEDPLDRTAIRDAIKATDMTTLIGPVKFGGGPHPNIGKTPIFGGQWQKGDKYRYDLKIVDNAVSDLIQPSSTMQLINWS